MVTAEIWPTLDYSRVPYRLYHDAEIYKQEQERIFKGTYLELSLPGCRDPQAWRFPGELCRRYSGHRQPRREWWSSCIRQSLRASRCPGTT